MSATYKIRLLNKTGAIRYPISLLWATSKTYYEENSKHADLWDWGEADYDYSDTDTLIDQLIAEQPTVVGFSVYVWNEAFVLDLSKKLKDTLPNVIIVYGGPQQDIKFNNNYFKDNPYVDLVIPSDAYGEVSVHDILENIVANNGSLNASVIPYSYWPDQSRIAQFNSLGPKKRDFKWPKNALRKQEKNIIPLIKKAKEADVGYVWLQMETSRGCPYKCSFCDWGGGTYTKTVKKDFSTVMDEITWAGENQIDGLFFCDANFGLFDIDIEYIKHCVKVKEKYGYPKQVNIQPTKRKIDNLYQVYLLLSNADMVAYYSISIQDLNDEVKKNVDRIDFSFEDQVQMFRKLQENANSRIPIWIETILGLPGASIDTIKESIHRINLEKLPFPVGYIWALLPAAPAYDPKYREEWKIKTVKGKTAQGMGSGTPLKEKLNRTMDLGVNKTLDDDNDTMTEYVVGTKSYDSDGWVNMNMLSIFTASTQQSEILDLISHYMWQEHSINYGDLFHGIMDTVLYDQQVDAEFREQMSKLKLSYDDWLTTEKVDVFVDYHNEFSFTIAPLIYYTFIILTNVDKFFDGVLLAISKFVEIDDRILDLCHFSKNRLIDISYRPGRTFSTQYDWPKYNKEGILVSTPKTYQITDTEVYTGKRWFPIDWEQYQGTPNYYSHYIYRVCYDMRSKKTPVNMIEVNNNQQ
jgi:putative methyltransferase